LQFHKRKGIYFSALLISKTGQHIPELKLTEDFVSKDKSNPKLCQRQILRALWFQPGQPQAKKSLQEPITTEKSWACWHIADIPVKEESIEIGESLSELT
jgi:hypothetical protein